MKKLRKYKNAINTIIRRIEDPELKKLTNEVCFIVERRDMRNNFFGSRPVLKVKKGDKYAIAINPMMFYNPYLKARAQKDIIHELCHIFYGHTNFKEREELAKEWGVDKVDIEMGVEIQANSHPYADYPLYGKNRFFHHEFYGLSAHDSIKDYALAVNKKKKQDSKLGDFLKDTKTNRYTRIITYVCNLEDYEIREEYVV